MTKNVEQIVGSLTHSETKQMLIECMQNLTIAEVAQCLIHFYDDKDDRNELLAQLEE